MRVLLTGGGGFIGCHTLAHILHNTDWEVVVIDSFRHKGLTDRIVEVLRDHPEWDQRINVLTHDLKAPISPLLRDKIGHIDYVINMASESHVDRSIDSPIDFVRNNVDLALTALEYAREIKPKVFIQISTDEVYGPAAVGTNHKEWANILPSNPYSASKAAQEAIAIAYWRTYNVPVVITNTMNNFGEMQDPEKFPSLVMRALSKDEEVTIHGRPDMIGSRYYMHARNHADALLFILQNTTPYLHQDGHIDMPDRYNIVGEREYDNLEFAQLIAKVMGKDLKYRLVDFHSARAGHDRRYALDGTKLDELGWKPPLTIEDSLKNTVDWTLERPEWL